MPIADLYLTYLAWNGYTDCAAAESGSFTGTSAAAATTTQMVSCSDGEDATFGTTGTTAKMVTDDPRSTWFLVNTISAVTMLLVNVLALGPIAEKFGGAPLAPSTEEPTSDSPPEESSSSDPSSL